MNALTGLRRGCYATSVRPSGKVNLVGLVMIAAVVGAAYWAVLFVPIYTDNWEVKDLVNSSFNRFPHERLGQIRVELVGRLGELKFASHQEADKFTGEMKTVPGLGLTEDQVITDDDTVRKFLTVRVTYDRVIQLWPTQKRRTIHFVVEKKGPYDQ